MIEKNIVFQLFLFLFSLSSFARIGRVTTVKNQKTSTTGLRSIKRGGGFTARQTVQPAVCPSFHRSVSVSPSGTSLTSDAFETLCKQPSVHLSIALCRSHPQVLPLLQTHSRHCASSLGSSIGSQQLSELISDSGTLRSATQDPHNEETAHRGFRTIRITESPRKNIFVMNRSLLTGFAF